MVDGYILVHKTNPDSNIFVDRTKWQILIMGIQPLIICTSLINIIEFIIEGVTSAIDQYAGNTIRCMSRLNTFTTDSLFHPTTTHYLSSVSILSIRFV